MLMQLAQAATEVELAIRCWEAGKQADRRLEVAKELCEKFLTFAPKAVRMLALDAGRCTKANVEHMLAEEISANMTDRISRLSWMEGGEHRDGEDS